MWNCRVSVQNIFTDHLSLKGNCDTIFSPASIVNAEIYFIHWNVAGIVLVVVMVTVQSYMHIYTAEPFNWHLAVHFSPWGLCLTRAFFFLGQAGLSQIGATAGGGQQEVGRVSRQETGCRLHQGDTLAAVHWECECLLSYMWPITDRLYKIRTMENHDKPQK